MQVGTRIVQFEVTVPGGCNEGETTTFALPDGRSEATRVLAGIKAGDKFPVMFPAPVLFHVVAPEGKKVGNEIEPPTVT